MADKAHSECVVGSRHAIHNLTYPDTANREAGTNEGSSTVLATANLYQVAKQDDNQSLWMLTGIGPPLTWLRVTSTGGGDFYGPDGANENGIVVFDGETGKIGKDSVAKVIDVSNTHTIQFDDPNDTGTWLDAVRAQYYVPNGTAGGTHICVGNQVKLLIMESSADHYVDASGKRAITEIISSAWSVPESGTIHHGDGDTLPALTLQNTGTNAGVCRIYVGSRAPESAVTAAAGSIYIRDDGDSSVIYFKATGSGNTGWVSLLPA